MKITKIEILSANNKELEYVKELFKNLNEIRIEKSYLTNLEIINECVSKGNAIKEYLKTCDQNINTKTISIGDNYNDQSMFNTTDYSYAVANAIPGLNNTKYLKSTSSEDFLNEVLKEVTKHEKNNICIQTM